MKKVLVWGHTGLVGKHVMECLHKEESIHAVRAESRLSEISIEMIRELNAIRPEFVVIAAGLTGRPNVDWCETHKSETWDVNVIGTFDLISECSSRGIPVVFFSTGCIYDYGDDPTRVFTETDPPNFEGSFYSWSKKELENMLKHHGLLRRVLVCRLRMPIQTKHDDRNLIDKLLKYDTIIADRPNSMSILEEIVPRCLQLGIFHGVRGLLNAVNPGAMTHKEILDLYSSIVRRVEPRFVKFDDFAHTMGARSNCVLDASRLVGLCVQHDLGLISNLSNGIEQILHRWSDSISDHRALWITGAAGFIGSHVLEELLTWNGRKINDFIIVDKLTYAGSIKNVCEAIRGNRRFNFVTSPVTIDSIYAEAPMVPPVTLIAEDPAENQRVYFSHCDIAEAEQLQNMLEQYEARAGTRVHHELVLHFAANTHVDRSFHNSIDFTRANVLGTHNLLELFYKIRERDSYWPKFLHVSTDEVHGTVDSPLESKSEPYGILDPTNPYAATKAAAEMLVRSYGHSYRMPYVITRANNVYGPRQYPEKLVPTAITKWMAGETFEVHGDGSSRRHFLYVKDIARAFGLIADYFRRSKSQESRVIMISGASEEPTVMQVVEDLKKVPELAKYENAVRFTRDRPFNDRRYYSARDPFLWDTLGWRAIVPWDLGLRETVRYHIQCDD